MGLRWTEIYNIKDPTLIDSAITGNILSILNKHAPIVTFRTGGKKGGNRNLSKECLDEIKTRNKLKKKAKITNLQ